MQYQFYDLGHIERGKIFEVSLGYVANVRIMDSSNYSIFKNGLNCIFQSKRSMRLEKWIRINRMKSTLKNFSFL